LLQQKICPNIKERDKAHAVAQRACVHGNVNWLHDAVIRAILYDHDSADHADFCVAKRALRLLNIPNAFWEPWIICALLYGGAATVLSG